MHNMTSFQFAVWYIIIEHYT